MNAFQQDIFPRDKQERLLELLGQEYKLFIRIRELTEAQTELLAADDLEGFNKSLDSRQEVIDEINGLHQESDILMQSYMSFSNTVSDGTNPAGGEKTGLIDSAVRRLEDAIIKCVELNDKNTGAAKNKTEEYIRQIGELSLKRKSIGKYALNVPNNPEHFDKMS